MKAIIPAAGYGSRMGALTAKRPKACLTVHGVPLIRYALDGAISFGAVEIVIVIAPDTQQYFASIGRSYKSCPVRYVVQYDRLGLVDAMLVALPLIGDHDVALLLPDEILGSPRREVMRARFDRSGADVMIGVCPAKSPDQIRKNYDIERDAQGKVSHVVEKPTSPQGREIGLGNCLFKNASYLRARTQKPDPVRRQRELTGLIQNEIDQGLKVETFLACADYVNVNASEDLALASRLTALVQSFCEHE